MKYLLSGGLLILLTGLFFYIARSTSSEPVLSTETQPYSTSDEVKQNEQRPASEQPDKYVYLLDKVLMGQDFLSYQGFNLVKVTRQVKVKIEGELIPFEASYAVLKRRGKVLAKFDGIYHDTDNATFFGLFPLINNQSQQLFITQMVSRGGAHWVLDLSSGWRVIYRSNDWEVGREEIKVIDIDGDGVYEISQEMISFYQYGFEKGMAMSDIPLPDIIFKYDAKKGKYLPANHLFQDFALEGIERRIEKLKQPGSYASRVLIFLDYVFAGKEKEAWTFFERQFDQTTQKEEKKKLLAILNQQPVYQYLRREGINR